MSGNCRKRKPSRYGRNKPHIQVLVWQKKAGGRLWIRERSLAQDPAGDAFSFLASCCLQRLGLLYPRSRNCRPLLVSPHTSRHSTATAVFCVSFCPLVPRCRGKAGCCWGARGRNSRTCSTQEAAASDARQLLLRKNKNERATVSGVKKESQAIGGEPNSTKKAATHDRAT